VLSRHSRPANGFNIRAVLAGQRHARGGEPIFLKHAHDGAFGAITLLARGATTASTFIAGPAAAHAGGSGSVDFPGMRVTTAMSVEPSPAADITSWNCSRAAQASLRTLWRIK
jgi:hypothetical protein